VAGASTRPMAPVRRWPRRGGRSPADQAGLAAGQPAGLPSRVIKLTGDGCPIPPAVTAPPRPAHRGPVLVALMVTMALSAMDNNIVSTAIPQVVRDLGGFSLFSWVFSSYLLTQTVTIPVYGKLADLWGHKPILIAGTMIFLAGSAVHGDLGTARGGHRDRHVLPVPRPERGRGDLRRDLQCNAGRPGALHRG
jgi:Major Facilitator Superfamily